jgi:erythromycin esterase
MKLHILLLFLVTLQSNSQSSQGIYKLNRMDSLMSKDVKQILDKNISEKRVIFLGEAEHHIGSDFLSKTQFIK